MAEPFRHHAEDAESGADSFRKGRDDHSQQQIPLKENLYENIPSLLYYGGSDTAFSAESASRLTRPRRRRSAGSIFWPSLRGRYRDGFLFRLRDCGPWRNAGQCRGRGQAPVYHGAAARSVRKNSPLGRRGFSNICEAGRERIAGRRNALGGFGPRLPGFEVGYHQYERRLLHSRCL